MDNQKPDFDAMFQKSQIVKFPKEGQGESSSFDEEFRQSYAKKKADKTPENPEVLDSTGRPVNRNSQGISFDVLGIVSAIIGVLAFLLVFAGMFFHAFLWLNVLLCVAGVIVGVAALMKKSSARIFAVLGIILCIFTLAVNVICMAVVAIISGASAIFGLIF